mmetsp:Transcript_10830/g.49216  ORF Transcript_10830/g.49216 Transcript_10830/m.49216 type:complete len:222 (-) Transcript_10830:1506-2171(-)
MYCAMIALISWSMYDLSRHRYKPYAIPPTIRQDSTTAITTLPAPPPPCTATHFMPSGDDADSVGAKPSSQPHSCPPNVFEQVIWSPLQWPFLHSSTSSHAFPSPVNPLGQTHVWSGTSAGSRPLIPASFLASMPSTQALSPCSAQHPPGCSIPATSQTDAGSSWHVNVASAPGWCSLLHQHRSHMHESTVCIAAGHSLMSWQLRPPFSFFTSIVPTGQTHL